MKIIYHPKISIIVYCILFSVSLTAETDKNLLKLNMYSKSVSFLGLFSNPKKFHGELIHIYGVMSVSTSINPKEKKPSKSGFGLLYSDKIHYDLHDASSAIYFEFSCEKEIDIHSIEGELIGIIGTYWFVDQGMFPDSMGMIQLGSVSGISLADSSKSLAMYCSSEIKNMPEDTRQRD